MVAAIRRANLPGPPEHSLVLRVSATGAVAVAIAACYGQGELPALVAVVAVGLVVAGNLFSYHRRARPLPWVKVALAAAVVGSFVWFLFTVGAQASNGNLSSVEGPLAVLFTLIQVTHAFDVPARRDLAFSLAGSATLMAAAGAQAVSSAFTVAVVLWLVFGVAGLLAMWGSMAGGAPVRPGTVAGALAGVLAAGLLVVAVLPPPRPDSRFVFPAALGGDSALSTPDALVGGSTATEPQHAATPSGPTRVGGFVGFAGPLDTALRGALGDQVVMRVRADRPSFWLAETFNHWDGQAWTSTPLRPGRSVQYVELTQGPPFTVPLPSDAGHAGGQTDIQTFYLAVNGPNLVFHAPEATEVWFPAHRLFVQPGGTIVAGTTLGAGSVYTVASLVDTPDPAQLRQAPGAFPRDALPPVEHAAYTQLPGDGYPRVRALAERVTAGIPAGDVYDRVAALEGWIGRHTRYTTDIPPLGPGQDTVTQFLFGSRRGFCEQISTSLVVMLRTLGIPAREAAGYVPGSYNPLTDLYEVQAKDAHSWVQVWFPGYGWQSFDPTAQVPLANPSPASVLTHDLLAGADRVPPVPVLAVLAVAAAVLLVRRRRRRAPATWAGALTADLVGAARRAGVPVADGDTLAAVAGRLEEVVAAAGAAPWPGAGPAELAAEAERFAYAGLDPGPERVAALRRAARRLRAAAPRLGRAARRGPPTSGPWPGPPPTSPRRPAGVASP